MQISSIPSGSWSNPGVAAQAAADSRQEPSSTKNPISGAQSELSVERSMETSDRDAQEKYDGSDSRQPGEPESPSVLEETATSLLDLPAIGPDENEGFDILG
jgi:hypothetical protein